LSQKLTVYADIPTNAPEGAFKTYISGFGTVPGTTAGNGAGKMFSTPGYPFAKGNTITVVAPQAAPTLVVLSPNGGEQFSLNNSLPYSYKLTYRPYGTTTISLVQFPSLTNPGIVHSFGGGWGENNEPDYIKYGNIGTIGNYSNITPGTYYWKVEYRSDDGTQNLVDFSDAPFSIITGISPTAPVLQVVSPNGGETYTEGQQITVKWNTQNIPASATLTLNLLSHTNPTAMHPLRNDAGNVTFSNDGEETVLLPPPAFGWHNGLNYKVRILVTGTPSMVDDSDNYFSITTANSNPVLPAGCTSTVGFSPVTGMPCSGTGGRPTIAPAPVAPATPGIVKAAFTRELKLGMSGADVTALQNRLMAEGVYTSKISGYFGTMTQAAVKRYQSKYGIPAVGAVGPRTLQVLNK
jgi:peptidoglycan hydrolase-like protein with peptidoglycan-binding domain